MSKHDSDSTRTTKEKLKFISRRYPTLFWFAVASYAIVTLIVRTVKGETVSEDGKIIKRQSVRSQEQPS